MKSGYRNVATKETIAKIGYQNLDAKMKSIGLDIDTAKVKNPIGKEVKLQSKKIDSAGKMQLIAPLIYTYQRKIDEGNKDCVIKIDDYLETVVRDKRIPVLKALMLGTINKNKDYADLMGQLVQHVLSQILSHQVSMPAGIKTVSPYQSELLKQFNDWYLDNF